ncbi:MAG: tyrosine-type recombinase/integrase [Eubacteriales bacterium]|nr:tyrosine-type recombinase/integrase [Eubacteriales bacterium]
MARRKKYPVLPNGYGTIRYLGQNRSRPYAVHPPATECDELGHYIRPKALCYVDDWYVGFAVLSAYHAGTYHPGDEIAFRQYREASDTDLDAFCLRLLRDHSRMKNTAVSSGPLFSDVYEQFFEWKFGESAAKKLSASSRKSIEFGYKKCSDLHNKYFKDITLEELQVVLNRCTLKEASLEMIVNFLKQIYNFAEPRDLCKKNYACYLVMPKAESDEHGVPFSEDELRILWNNKDNEDAALILIMCYTGFRASAYAKMEVHLSDGYLKGGIKTKSSIGRIVPIHHAILPLISNRCKNDIYFFPPYRIIRSSMIETLARLHINHHTPHDCRHTFSALCERYGVNEADRKRLLGHSFGSDITNGIYGHRTVEELRTEVEKIRLPNGI